MNFYDKIQNFLNEEAKKVKEKKNKKLVNLNLVVNISDDEDFEDVRPIDVQIKKDRPVKRIIKEQIAENKKKIILKKCFENYIVMRRMKQKNMFIKKLPVVVDSDKDIVMKSDHNNILSEEERKEYIHLLKLDISKMISIYRRRKLSNDEIVKLLERCKLDRRIRFENMKEVTERMVNWMERCYKLERIIDDLKRR